MTALRDLEAGDRFVILRAPSRIYIKGSVGEDPGHVWCEDVENINWSAHVPLGERVRRITDRPREGSNRPQSPPQGVAAGGPHSGGREPRPPTRRDDRSSHHRGSTPGRLILSGALRLARDFGARRESVLMVMTFVLAVAIGAMLLDPSGPRWVESGMYGAILGLMWWAIGREG